MKGECAKCLLCEVKIYVGLVFKSFSSLYCTYFFFLDLYNRGLVYFDIRIDDWDCIVVPPLQGFVMNRVQGDYFETLLYKIFVSIDEHTSIEDLATVLQVDLNQVKVLTTFTSLLSLTL